MENRQHGSDGFLRLLTILGHWHVSYDWIQFLIIIRYWLKYFFHYPFGHDYVIKQPRLNLNNSSQLTEYKNDGLRLRVSSLTGAGLQCYAGMALRWTLSPLCLTAWRGLPFHEDLKVTFRRFFVTLTKARWSQLCEKIRSVTRESSNASHWSLRVGEKNLQCRDWFGRRHTLLGSPCRPFFCVIFVVNRRDHLSTGFDLVFSPLFMTRFYWSFQEFLSNEFWSLLSINQRSEKRGAYIWLSGSADTRVSI